MKNSGSNGESSLEKRNQEGGLAIAKHFVHFKAGVTDENASRGHAGSSKTHRPSIGG